MGYTLSSAATEMRSSSFRSLFAGNPTVSQLCCNEGPVVRLSSFLWPEYLAGANTH
jgi:hypothetical protein